MISNTVPERPRLLARVADDPASTRVQKADAGKEQIPADRLANVPCSPTTQPCRAVGKCSEKRNGFSPGGSALDERNPRRTIRQFSPPSTVSRMIPLLATTQPRRAARNRIAFSVKEETPREFATTPLWKRLR
jgi:hypothetical protein